MPISDAYLPDRFDDIVVNFLARQQYLQSKLSMSHPAKEVTGEILLATMQTN